MPTPTVLSVALSNNTTNSTVYAYITGYDLSREGRSFILQSDGVTGYWPDSPPTILQPLAVDCAIQLNAPGRNTQPRFVTIPRLSGGRVWFSLSVPLTFLLNPGGSGGGGAVVEPSATNPSDPNFDIFWSFAEFTFNERELYVNISYVDFVSLPVGISVTSSAKGVNPGKTKTRSVAPFPAHGLAEMAKKMASQDAKDGHGWGRLVTRKSYLGKRMGEPLRVLSPNAGKVLGGIDGGPPLFEGYYASYVNKVWQKYSCEDLTIDTQHKAWGTFQCRVHSDDELLHCVSTSTGKEVGTFWKPTAADVFSCSTGPFAPRSSNGEEQAIMLNLGARLAAAFNRSTLLLNSKQPEGETVDTYYQNEDGGGVTNHYARTCHAIAMEGRGYAFPYDDVSPSGGLDQSGFIREARPVILGVSIG